MRLRNITPFQSALGEGSVQESRDHRRPPTPLSSPRQDLEPSLNPISCGEPEPWTGAPQVGLHPVASEGISQETAVLGSTRGPRWPRTLWAGRCPGPTERSLLGLRTPGVANTWL